MNKREGKLINQVRKGDVRALQELIQEYEKEIYNLAYNITIDKEVAMDITIETFEKLYKSIGNFQEDIAFSSWLYKITLNYCLEYIEKKKIVEQEMLQDRVRASISSLPKEQSIILILRDLQQLPYDAIAEVLDCSVETVEGNLSKGRWKLKEILISRRRDRIEKVTI